ncbi:MAG: YceI family protein [Halobacteriovoraceae bacterium]|nr:YceI family protein [Halobacteriovoraceae bacterium]MCB9095627.1 YceI family protein [Halobacteriovoraceae bacterium]
MKKLSAFILFSFLWVGFAHAQKLKIHIPLSPAGSFDAEGKIVNGYVKKKGSSYVASKMSVVAKELKTGIDLRDEHLHDRLKAKKFPKIEILKASGKGGKGKAEVKIRGVKKSVAFTYKVKGKTVEFKMPIVLKQFKFDHDKDSLSYMGVGVSDKVEVTGTLKVK